MSFGRAGVVEGEIGSPRQDALTTVMPWLLCLTAGIVVFNYFEIHHNLWFLQLLDGYVIKMWLPPLVLAGTVLTATRRIDVIKPALRGYGLLNVFLAFYVLAGLASLLRNESLLQVGKYGLVMFAPLTLYAAVLMICDNRSRIETLLVTLFWAGVALSLYVFYLYDVAGVESWRDRTVPMTYMWSAQMEDFRLSLNYHQSRDYFAYSRTLKFIDEPAFAAMLAPLVLFGFQAAGRPGRTLRVLYYVFSAFLFSTMLYTASRAAFIAFMAVLPVFLWRVRRRKAHVLVILAVVTALTLSNGFMQYRLTQLAGTVLNKIGAYADSPILDRWIGVVQEKIAEKVLVHPEGHMESVPKTWQDIQAAPLLGNGATNLLTKYRGDATGWGTEHNRYLYIAAAAGLLTAAPYILFIATLIVLSLLALKKQAGEDTDRLDIGSLLTAAAILFFIQLNNCGLERYYYWVFFALTAAWVKITMNGEGHEHPAH